MYYATNVLVGLGPECREKGPSNNSLWYETVKYLFLEGLKEACLNPLFYLPLLSLVVCVRVTLDDWHECCYQGGHLRRA